MSVRVDLLDPPAYSPAYDDALASALAKQGAQVRLLTSPFAYGAVPEPAGYERVEAFYGHAGGRAASKRRTASKLATHVPDMLRYRARADADVVHVEWLTVPGVDLRLLPRRPTVLTVHDPLRRGSLPAPAPDLSRLDAVVVHSWYARTVLAEQHEIDLAKVHVIRHGAFRPSGDLGALPPELSQTEVPVVLCFGLIRPYKGIETLLAAWEGITQAELWIVGRPMMDISSLAAGAPAGVRFVPRYVSPAQEAALYRRADVAVLPYERSDRFGFSGVLATALGYAKAIVVSDVGGLCEVTELGAARSFPPGDAEALHMTLAELVADVGARSKLSRAAARAAAGPYSWTESARSTLALYETIRR